MEHNFKFGVSYAEQRPLTAPLPLCGDVCDAFRYAKDIGCLLYTSTVNAVCPGPTATDIVKTYTEDELKNLNSKIMLGRLGEPEEIAAAVCFLASEEAGYITAAMIDVNGGFYIGS